MDKDRKTEIIKQFAKTENDTGSSEVQIAVLTERIKELTEHMRDHRKDQGTRRGLLNMVSKRRKLLKYLSREDHDKYISLTDTLGLRRK
jgi:small subunit ribosomal protein S15